MLQRYLEDGYTIAKIPGIQGDLASFRSDIYALFDRVRLEKQGKHVFGDQDILDFFREDRPSQLLAHQLSRYLPLIYRFVARPELLAIIQQLGIRQPIVECDPLLRCDLPTDGFIFQQHQDYSYNIGSSNSVTVWIPLQDVTLTEGALKVAPGTHTLGLYPQNHGLIDRQYEFSFIQPTVLLGEALIFNQKLVHESGKNISDQIRFSMQIRFSDLMDAEYTERNWPRNHRTEHLGFASPTIPLSEIKTAHRTQALVF